ncbi:unnamed protein product [Scytosiphon promiscuus]
MWKRAKGDMPGAHSDERPSETSNQDIHEEQMWACPFNRDDLLRIWAQNDGGSLATEDEKRAFKLLATYNGSNPVQRGSILRQEPTRTNSLIRSLTP